MSDKIEDLNRRMTNIETLFGRVRDLELWKANAQGMKAGVIMTLSVLSALIGAGMTAAWRWFTS